MRLGNILGTQKENGFRLGDTGVSLFSDGNGGCLGIHELEENNGHKTNQRSTKSRLNQTIEIRTHLLATWVDGVVDVKSKLV